jgi:hypothetical protein
MDAASFIETASPPASSAATEILDPLDRRAKLFWSMSLDLVKFAAA